MLGIGLPLGGCRALQSLEEAHTEISLMWLPRLPTASSICRSAKRTKAALSCKKNRRVERPMHVVICGGGVIGACTAYFLRRRGIEVTVVERSAVASSASGKAGGFLALDWCTGSALDALARRSFALHASLHKEVEGDWAYQRMTAYSGRVLRERAKRRHGAARLSWLSDSVVIDSRLSTTETTAIVHPRSFTWAMMNAAQKHGARLQYGEVTGVARRGDAI